MIVHKRVRVYLLVPDASSRKEVNQSEIASSLIKRYAHLVDHPIYGIKVKEFINEDFSRLGEEPPSLPDLPLGFSEALANMHNEFIKAVYSRYSPSNQYSFLVRIPVEQEMLEQVQKMIDDFVTSSNNVPENKRFDEAVKLVSRIVELGIVSGEEIWPRDVIDDLRDVFLGVGIDPRELKDYYSLDRTKP